MKSERNPNAPLVFARRYAAVSLFAVLVTTIALGVLYRELSIRAIVDFGEQSNVTVATTTLSAMLPELAGYLQTTETVAASATTENVPAGLLSLLETSVRDTPIERIKIYNRNGVVLYSTLEHEIGTIDSANPRFQRSIGGQVHSVLHYRDLFNGFHSRTGDDNLIETYVPIRQRGKPQPMGVLELYTDVKPIVRVMTRKALLIMTGIAMIMFILYSVLLYVVRRAEKVIAGQRQTILERTRTLEVLSARMLDFEETERRRVAWELQEEIAQTLSALKIRVEAFVHAAAQSQSPTATAPGDEIVPLVQAAIRDIRALAMDLRPPALDDFGLVATTRSLCREAEQVRGHSGITADIAVREEEVPDLLKSVIFRITQQTLKRLVGTPGVSDIRVGLKGGEGLELVVGFRAGAGEGSDGDKPRSSPQERPITDFWERAVLSGGTFSEAHTDAGDLQYRATWIV